MKDAIQVSSYPQQVPSMTEVETTGAARFDVIMLTAVHAATDGRIFYREAITLAEAGLRVAVIGPHPRSELLVGVWIEAVTRQNGRLRRFLITGSDVLRAARRLGGRVFVFHDPELFGVGLILRLLGNKVVYDCHENLPAQILQKPWIPPVLRRPISPIARAAEWFGSRMLSGVVTARDAVLPRFPKNRRVLVQNFPTKSALQSADGPPMHERKNVVIYVGGLSRIRGIADLVEAFRGIGPDEAQLWLVGNFDNETFQKQILDEAGPNVKWLGFMEHPEVLKLYKSVKIGTCLLHPTPSHRYSQPIKLYEYLAAGIPVIASDFPEFTAVLDGCGVQVNPHDSGQIARAIRDLLSDTDRLTQMSRIGRERVLSSFCWEGEASRLIQFCRDLVAST